MAPRVRESEKAHLTLFSAERLPTLDHYRTGTQNLTHDLQIFSCLYSLVDHDSEETALDGLSLGNLARASSLKSMRSAIRKKMMRE